MTRLTAKEAKALAGKTADEKIDSLLDAIRRAATAKQHSIRIGLEYKEDLDLWVNGGYNNTTKWKFAKDSLENLGYTVKFFCREGSIAVNMYTIVSW